MWWCPCCFIMFILPHVCTVPDPGLNLLIIQHQNRPSPGHALHSPPPGWPLHVSYTSCCCPPPPPSHCSYSPAPSKVSGRKRSRMRQLRTPGQSSSYSRQKPCGVRRVQRRVDTGKAQSQGTSSGLFFSPSPSVPYRARPLANLQEPEVRVDLEVAKELAQPKPLLPQQARAVRRAWRQAARGGAKDLRARRMNKCMHACQGITGWRLLAAHPPDFPIPIPS